MSYCPGCDGTKGCSHICGGPGNGSDKKPAVEQKPEIENLFDLSENIDAEVMSQLLKAGNVRIEKIVSTGQISPYGFWYDQDENEWVCVLEGKGVIGYEDGREVALSKGQSVNIPAHTKHRVTYTANPTIWLAVFYG